MQLPSFNYLISRPYPYKWFTWVVLVGGTCATIFSILNLAANGYVLTTRYTINYNETIHEKRWTSRFPFVWLDKTITTCQAQDIPVNSQLFTNMLSLPYTLTSVWREQGGRTVAPPSLEYKYNILENCTVAFM
jgi:hypothetical protein